MITLENHCVESKSREQLWHLLLSENLVSGDIPLPNSGESSVQQAWYIRVMLGFSGWLGALFLLGFIAIGWQSVMESVSAALFVGIVCCAVAYGIFKAARNNDFVMQFGLAISIAGQGVFVVGLFNAFEDNSVLFCFTGLLFQLLLTVIMSNVIHRFLTTLGSIFACVYLLQIEGVYGIAPGLIAITFTCVWLSTRLLLNPAVWRPVAYGLTLALLYTEGGRLVNPFYFLLHGESSGDWWMHYGWWVGSSLVNLSLLVSTLIILHREKKAFNSQVGVAALVVCGLLCVATYFAPGLSAALLMILIGFAAGNRILTGIGLFALLGFISHYYYQIESTLLVKSALLAITAAILLTLRSAFHRLFPEKKMGSARQIAGEKHA